MANGRSYWKNRMRELEDEQYQRSKAYYQDVQEQFRRASNSIQMDIEHWYRRLAENNDISYASAKRFLKNSELEEFRWTVEDYIKAGRENAVDQRWMKELENASTRFHISYLEAMKLQAQQHAELLSTQFEAGMTDYLHNNYAEQFYRTAFEISKGTGMGFNVARLNEKGIDTLIKRPWAQDGKAFSDRIWSNKEKLVANLHTELAQCIIRGEAPRSAIERLAAKMEVSKAQAGNLIMTEAAAISSSSQRECFKQLGVEKFEFDATLDGRTCEICGSMDQKVFPMSAFEIGVTAPPIHPRCRCDTSPAFDDWDEFGVIVERSARDPETGKTVFVDGSLNYGEWKKRFVEGDEKGYEVTLTQAMKAAVLRYVSPAATALNDKLRRGTQLTDFERQWIMDLDEALEYFPAYEGNLLRDVDISDPELIQEYFDAFEVGQEWSSGQYLSTTKADEYNPKAHLRIYIQNAKRGHDLGQYNAAEKEVLYERGAKFKVLQKMSHEGKWYIVLEEM
ncbi:MAG: minor capsid protein [Eubacteriales bacterium]|nr:minor capsid protein [Eubacteriales bacterium]